MNTEPDSEKIASDDSLSDKPASDVGRIGRSALQVLEEATEAVLAGAEVLDARHHLTPEGAEVAVVVFRPPAPRRNPTLGPCPTCGEPAESQTVIPETGEVICRECGESRE